MLVPPFPAATLAPNPLLTIAAQTKIKCGSSSLRSEAYAFTPEQALEDADGAAENRTSPQADYMVPLRTWSGSR